MAEQQQSFTPGPWVASDTRYNRDFRTCVNVMTGDGLRFVAAVSCDPPSDSAQLYANARLIAAAPELFDALEASVQRIRDRQIMRAGMPGDINASLALELDCMLRELERIAGPALASAQAAK